MRVTDLTKQTHVLRNMQNNAQKLQELQDNMATGRRINELSDDPVGAVQVQDFRTKLSFLNNTQRNIENSFLWLDRTEGELQHMSELLRRAKTLILSQVNASADDASREVTAEELDAIIDGLIDAGNSKLGKVYVFAGSRTLTRPLARTDLRQPAVVNAEHVELDEGFPWTETGVGAAAGGVMGELLGPGGAIGAAAGGAAGAAYGSFLTGLDESLFQADFVGHSANRYVVKITRPGPVGRARYAVSDDGGETWSDEKTLHPTVEAVNEDGKPSDKVQLRLQGELVKPGGVVDEEVLQFPKGLRFEFEPNPPVTYRGNDDKREIPTGEGKTMPINLTARELFYRDEEHPKSLDVFDALFSIRRSLRDNDPVPLEQRLDELDRAADQILRHRADVGAVRKELEDRVSKLNDREVTTTKQLAEIEDLNFPRAVSELNMADVRNRATLDTSSRLIQPSLLNFLR